jgi:hypothetical protein
VLSVRSRTTRSSKGKVCPIPSPPFSHSNIILILPPFVSPPLYPPPSCAFCPRALHPFPLSVYSSSQIQKQTHSNSRSNSVSSVSTRPTQPATEIASSARFQTNCLAQSLVISSYARIFVIGFSRTVSAMPHSSTMNVAWMSTFLSCVNQVRPHLCSIISFSA